MKAVIDTNVVAYHLLETQPFAAEARKVWDSLSEPLAPASWAAELANVVWMAVRTGVLPAKAALARLHLAAQLGIESVSVQELWQPALVRSIATGIAVYDTLFVELAARERVPLATFDTKVLKAFPGIARRPGAVVRLSHAR